MGWSLIKRYNYSFEIWKTPKKYLACYKYQGIFKYFDTFKEAEEFVLENV